MNNLKRRTSDDIEEGDEGSGADDSFHYRLAFHAYKIEEDLDKPKKKQGKKLSRNESEKLRRDRLNMYIAELARLVPMIMSTDRKMDKSSILRLTVAYLRIHHDLARNPEIGSKPWRPDFLKYESLGSMLLESVGGFMLVIDKKGLLIYASESIRDSLGHSLVDILGYEFARIVHPEDIKIVQRQFEEDTLLREELQNEFSENGDPEEEDRDSSLTEPDSKPQVMDNHQRTFYLRMLNIKNRNTTKYENVQFTGVTKVVPPLHGEKSNPSNQDVCLIGVAKVMKPDAINELVPILPTTTSPNQWISRHALDGKITYSDHRAAWLTGFMPGESIGLSPYALTHPDDISALVAVHNMFLKTGNIPQTVFRMYTKSRDILFVTTNTHMAVDMWTQKPKYIISINEVVSEEEGKELLTAQSNRIKALECATAQLSLEEKEKNEESDKEEEESVASGPSLAPSGHMSVASDGSYVIIPDMVKRGEDKVDIVVGEERYQINLKNQKQFKSKSKTSLNAKNIFDMHCHLDENTDVPLKKPNFLGLTDVGSVLGSPGGMSIGNTDSVFLSDTEMDSVHIPNTAMNMNGKSNGYHQTQHTDSQLSPGINNNMNGMKVPLPSPQRSSTENGFPIPKPHMSPKEIKRIQDWLELVNTDPVVTSCKDGREDVNIPTNDPGGSPPLADLDDSTQVPSPDTTQEKPMLSIQKELARQLLSKHNALQKSIETQTAELANLRKQMEVSEKKMMGTEALVQTRILRVQELEEKLSEQKKILETLKQEYLRCVEPKETYQPASYGSSGSVINKNCGPLDYRVRPNGNGVCTSPKYKMSDSPNRKYKDMYSSPQQMGMSYEQFNATQYSNISSATSPCPMPSPDSSTLPLPAQHHMYSNETVTSSSANINSSISPKMPMGMNFPYRTPMKMEPQGLDPAQIQQHYLHHQQQIQQQQLLQSWGGDGGGNRGLRPMTNTMTNTGDMYSQGLHQIPTNHTVKLENLGQQQVQQQPDLDATYPTVQQNGSQAKFLNFDSNRMLPVDEPGGMPQGAYFNGQNEYLLEGQFSNSANGQQNPGHLPELADLDFEDRPVTMADFPFLSS